MKADPNDQLSLLTLKEFDTQIYQLKHQRSTLPLIAEVEQMESEHRTTEASLAEIDGEYQKMRREMSLIEGETETISQRLERDRARLSDGSVGSPKQLENLEHEIETLAAKLSAQEDNQLEMMEKLDTAENAVLTQRSHLDQVHGEVEKAAQLRDAELQRIDEHIQTLQQKRAGLASQLPSALLAVYERSGAGELRAKRCGNCRMELPATEYAAIEKATPDTVLRCESCGAVLVRSEESGL